MSRAVLSRAIVCASLCFANPPTGRAFQLITEQEAAMPDDLLGMKRGGPTQGPEVVFVSPASEAGLMKSPLNLKIRFKAHGEAKIDSESVLITYRKLPPIDITQRVAPFIQADGIEIATAELPPGAHRFRIDVRDTDGRKATGFLLINIGK